MFDPIFQLLFWFHDLLSDFALRHVAGLKRTILVVAHISLLGLFFPDSYRSYGSAAQALLLVILFISPFAKITRMRLAMQLLGFRRELGIMMGYFALVHGLGYVIDPWFFSEYVVPYLSFGMILQMDPRLLTGIVAFFLTLPLLLTSNGIALRMLGGVRWKRLHFLVYPLIIFVEFHQIFRFDRPEWNTAKLAQGAVIVSAYFLLKLIAGRRNWFSAVYETVGLMGEKYGKFSSAEKISS